MPGAGSDARVYRLYAGENGAGGFAALRDGDACADDSADACSNAGAGDDAGVVGVVCHLSSHDPSDDGGCA